LCLCGYALLASARLSVNCDRPAEFVNGDHQLFLQNLFGNKPGGFGTTTTPSTGFGTGGGGLFGNTANKTSGGIFGNTAGFGQPNTGVYSRF